MKRTSSWPTLLPTCSHHYTSWCLTFRPSSQMEVSGAFTPWNIHQYFPASIILDSFCSSEHTEAAIWTDAYMYRDRGKREGGREGGPPLNLVGRQRGAHIGIADDVGEEDGNHVMVLWLHLYPRRGRVRGQ